MTSAKKKGDDVERQVMKILEAQGYTVMKSPRTMKRIWTPKGVMWTSQANDFFGAFDLVAKTLGGFTHWIQCKLGQDHIAAGKHKIEEIKHLFNECERLEVWEKVPRKGYLVHALYETGWQVLGAKNMKGEEVHPDTIRVTRKNANTKV